MKLVQKHLIKHNHKEFAQIDNLAFLSKNLYNCAVYLSRQAYFKGEKSPTMTDLYHQLKTGVDYKALPAKVSQLVLKQVEKTFKSFFAASKESKKYPDKFTGKPKLPKYKDKLKGRNLLTYNYQAISKKLLKKGIINPSGTNIKIPTQLEKIVEVRIIPKLNSYCVEIVYEKLETKSNPNTNYAFIDLGLNNLAALTSNKLGFQPTLICGKALKSGNQKYNKTLAKLKSELPANQKTSKKIQGLTLKRNCKVDHYLHTASRYIPHTRFINQLTYKCQLAGIEVKTVEESYTSKCSFLDNESMQKHNHYLGNRVKRGLFRAKSGYCYSADVNGSLNIGRKVVGEVAFGKNPIERFVVNPVRVKAYKEVSSHICL